MPVSTLSLQNVNELQNLLDRGDRGGFYYRYYELTGSSQALLQAQITTYSGVVGGLAINGNVVAKSNNFGIYNLSLDDFSTQIASNLLRGIRLDISNNGTGILSDARIQDLDAEVWDSKGMLAWFPGSFQLLWNGSLNGEIIAGTIGGGLHLREISGGFFLILKSLLQVLC